MAQSWYFRDISNQRLTTDSGEARELGLLHDPDAVTPYVGLLMQVRSYATDPADVGDITGGRIRTTAHYVGGTQATLTNKTNPWSTYNFVAGAATWVIIRGDGNVYDFTGTPSDSSVITKSATAAANEQIAIDGSDALDYVIFYWTPPATA